MRARLIGGFTVAGLVVAFAIALFASPFASSSPDGMSRVAINEGFDHRETASPIEDSSPVGGYTVKGINHEQIGTGISGAVGVGATFAIGLSAFHGLRVVGRRRNRVSAS
ncbi:PDGLE domain-containing protein [Aeromicrobium wangtongii]|uniref:PDGLE domain-containing protein n=1 Tax=Aeromicrobium wangtongii TaxID=2969247 RepID=UPI00201782A0|nr:PDGLE domain-containing protein [Aeromicrobium wangtongii]MCL3817666.1 PDGLE domain-containing protein [Aeromicrobium wangtongii]